MNLTPRETDVLLLVVEGLEYKQVATRLAISRNTVCAHVQSIKKKTGVSGPPQRLVRWYYEVYRPAA